MVSASSQETTNAFQTGCWCFKGVSKSHDIYSPQTNGSFRAFEEYSKSVRKPFADKANTQAARDLWWNKLQEVYKIETKKEPPTTNIQVIYYDSNTSVEYCKTFSIGPEETAKDCIKVALDHLEMRNADSDSFQLWAKTARDESPYPLIGHERPFAIKLCCLRDSLSSEDGFDLDHCNNKHDPVAKCHFILRNISKAPVNENKKSFKKLSARGMRIGHVFRRSLSKEQTGCLFGLPLSKVIEGENLPKPVMGMLYQVFAKGPFIQGIFRKSANARLVRELRDKLDNGEEVSWEHVPVLVTAALLKDFLRSLPDPLLTTALYPQWRSALDTPNLNTKLYRMKGVLAQLPKPNHLLLIHFLCVLHHIARRSSHTLMSAANLSVCVGPSLLWSNCPNVTDDLRIVPGIVECLITHCEYLCGSHIPTLLGDLRDSGTEESDSLKRDDSSIDSLECSPPPRKDKISLSRDSGLTMSDSQLYTPDEEESGSTSSSGYDPSFESHSKVAPSVSMPSNYVRVYGGWEERLNPNFQRQAWFRQRSRRMNSLNNNSSGSMKNEVRRTASEESLLDDKPPPTPPRRNKPSHEYNGSSNIESSRCHMYGNVYSSSQCIDKVTKDERGNKELDVDSLRTPNFGKSRRTVSRIRPVLSEDNFNKFNNGTLSVPVNTYSETNLVFSNLNINKSNKNTKPSSTMEHSIYGYYEKPSVDKKAPEGEDSSTLSDEDCTPHVSRSNSRGDEVASKIQHHSPRIESKNCIVRGRIKRKEEKAAYRSRSVPPPPPYRPPPPATSRRAPITSYHLREYNQPQKYIITRTFMDEESYV